MSRTLRQLAPLVLCLATACSSSDGDETAAQKQTKQLTAFNEAQDGYEKAVELAHVRACEVIKAASYDFHGKVTTADDISLAFQAKLADADGAAGTNDAVAVLNEFTGEFDDALAAAVLARRKAFVSSYELLAAMAPLEIGASEGSSTAALSVPGAGPGGARVGKRESPLVFVALGALVGAVMLNKALNDTMDSATATRSKPLTDKIEKANDAELEVIKEEMGIKASATKEETIKELKKRPAHKQLEAVKKAEAGLAIASVEEAGVEMVDHQEVMASISQAAVKCGETAATQVAGFWATGAGGQGVAQVMEAIGAGAVVANIVDMSVSIAGVQPLDLFAKVVSKAKKKHTIVPAPQSDPDVELPTIETPEKALEVLKDTEAPADQVAAATAKLGDEMMSLGKVPGTTEADGSITAELPERVFVDKVVSPSATTVLRVPDMGPADVLLSAPERVPQLIEDVDTSAADAPNFTFDNESIEDFVKTLNPSTDPDGGTGGADGGTGGSDGGTGGPGGNLTINFPNANLQVDEDIYIQVHCAGGTAFPASLDVTFPGSASASWGSRSTSCPIDVIYSNSTAGTQNLSFKLTDADGKIQTASASPVLFDGDVSCDQPASTACADSYPGTPMGACASTCAESYDYETAKRDSEICRFACEAADASHGCACSAAAGCLTGENVFCCQKNCRVDYVSCLRAIDSKWPNNLGDCAPAFGSCIMGC